MSDGLGEMVEFYEYKTPSTRCRLNPFGRASPSEVVGVLTMSVRTSIQPPYILHYTLVMLEVNILCTLDIMRVSGAACLDPF